MSRLISTWLRPTRLSRALTTAADATAESAATSPTPAPTPTATPARRTVAQAVRRGISIGPRKLNDVCRLIRGRTLEDALAQLAVGTKRLVRHEVADTLRSAAANGEHGLGLDRARMVVHEAYVGKGVYRKVMHYHAKGRGAIGHKYFSHLTVRVREVSVEEWRAEYGPSTRYVHKRFRPESSSRPEVPQDLIKPWTVKSQMDINVEGKL